MHDSANEAPDDDGAQHPLADGERTHAGYFGDARPAHYFYYQYEQRRVFLVPCCFNHAVDIGMSISDECIHSIVLATYGNPKCKPIKWQ